MKIFEHFNKNATCPICGTNEDAPCVLIGIVGTEKGNNQEAKAVHVKCLPYFMMDTVPPTYEDTIIYGFIPKNITK